MNETGSGTSTAAHIAQVIHADINTVDASAVILLDVDGVLSPFGPGIGLKEPVRHVPLFPGGMRFSESVLDRLRTWHQRPEVSIEWLTTWEDQAVTVLAPLLGLPPWPTHTRNDVLGRGRCPGEPEVSWWKERIVRARLETGARVAWVDDDISQRADVAGLRRRYAERLLMVSPDRHMGLASAHMDSIEAWLTLAG